MDMTSALSDPLTCELFTVLRSTDGSFTSSGWQETKTTLRFPGLVSQSPGEEIQQLPEADRVFATCAFYSTKRMFQTRRDDAGNAMTSDIIVWHGDQYRLIRVFDYSSRGFWKALGSKMAGQ